MKMKGTELFVKAMIAEGVENLFAYPGGYAIDIFDALYMQDKMNVILPRHEQGLIHAADGYARATGKPGVCLVTSGPGATNLVTGISTANYDSVPLVCFTGQVPTTLIGNDAFQEVDIIGITRSICKYGVTVTKREDLGRIIKEAFYIATTGRPGPVVIDLPKDIMLEEGTDEYPKSVSIRGYKPSTAIHIGQLKKSIELLENAKKPVFLIGGGVNISGAKEEFTKLVEKTKIPVITTIMGKGAIDTSSPYYVGNIGMHGSYASNKAISECDVLYSIGTRFNDRITGKISEFATNAKIVHIDIDSSTISRNISVDIPIVADAKNAISAMIDYTKEYDTKDWLEKIKGWKQKHPIAMPPHKSLTPEKILNKINEMFSEPIIVTDVGQHQMWSSQFIELNGDAKLLTSGGLGTMGFGFPAALGAKFGNPDRDVICISGDGGMQMNIQEMATAVVYELPVIICILNNSYLGMVRQWQELFFDKHYSSTCTRRRKSCDLRCPGPNEKCPPYVPDFIELAHAYRAQGIRVTEDTEIENAFEKARNNTKTPTIIEFIIDPAEMVFPMVPGGNALTNMILDI